MGVAGPENLLRELLPELVASGKDPSSAQPPYSTPTNDTTETTDSTRVGRPSVTRAFRFPS